MRLGRQLHRGMSSGGRLATADGSACISGYSLRYFAPSSIALDSRTIEWIATGLSAAMPTLKMGSLFRLRPEILARPDHMIVAVRDADNGVVGILTSKWHHISRQRCFLQLPIQMIDAHLQGSQMFRHMWRLHFERLLRDRRFPPVIAMRTCNPVAYQAMHTFTRIAGVRMFPELGQGKPVVEATLVKQIAATLNPSQPFDCATGILSGAGIPPDLYGAIPRSPKPAVDGYFRNLSPTDRVLCVLSIPDSAQDGILRMLRVKPRSPRLPWPGNHPHEPHQLSSRSER